MRGGSTTARVRSSTLASWLWSATPTICVVHETSTGRSWWTPPGSGLSRTNRSDARTRTLRFDRSLDEPADWGALTQSVIDQWSHHQGVGALMDVPLVLQVLTEAALATNLWTRADGQSDAIHHAAAIHVYRTVCAINALTGSIGSEGFADIRNPTKDEVGLSWGLHLVSRDAATLGVVSSIELQPQAAYLLNVLASSGAELAAAIPRLQQLARMPELGVPAGAAELLGDITPLQLAIIDPTRAAELSSSDLPQVPDRSLEHFPASPEIDNQAIRPLARPTIGQLRAMRDSLEGS